MRFGLKKILLFFVLLMSVAISAQNDLSITNVQLVGGSPLCPNEQVSFQVTIRNNNTGGAPVSVVNPETIYF